MPEDYARISPTALMVARVRATYTDMPFAQDLFELARKEGDHSPLKWAMPILAKLAVLFPQHLDQLSTLEGRYLAINLALATLGKDVPVIEIAAGLSGRGLAWQGKGLYIETDLPDMIRTKQRAVRKIITRCGMTANPQHHFFALDATDPKAWDRLGRMFFPKKTKKVAIIHEGLLGYLTREEQGQLRDNIRNFLETYAPQGAWITTDFSTPHRHKSLLPRIAMRLIRRSTRREFKQFTSAEQVTAFLHAGGLDGKVIDNSPVLDQLSCVAKSRMDKARVKGFLSSYRPYVITLRQA